jgi:polyhydroxybutyrate depolymerase
MAENESLRSAFVARDSHNCHCPHADSFASADPPHLVAIDAHTKSVGADRKARKKPQHRAISQIIRKNAWLSGALGLGLCACGPSVVDLGARGGGVAGPVTGASAAVSGGGAAAGVAGTDLVDAGQAGAGAAAVGAAGSGPVAANDAGPVVPRDAGIPGLNADPSPGCGLPPPATDTSITVGAATALYIVDTATGYDRNRPYPLIMSFRSANVTIAAFRRTLDLTTAIGADGIVVNVDCANGAGMWDLQRDPPVFDALLAKLEASYCIDRRRIFVVGHETGGIYANILACTHSDELRGLGSIAGVMPMSPCTGGLAVWISQANVDPTLRMLGRADRDFWVTQNQCNAAMSMPVDPPEGGCLEYAGCAMGRPVRYCEYVGNQAVPSFAATALWGFFKGL